MTEARLLTRTSNAHLDIFGEAPAESIGDAFSRASKSMTAIAESVPIALAQVSASVEAIASTIRAIEWMAALPPLIPIACQRTIDSYSCSKAEVLAVLPFLHQKACRFGISTDGMLELFGRMRSRGLNKYQCRALISSLDSANDVKYALWHYSRKNLPPLISSNCFD